MVGAFWSLGPDLSLVWVKQSTTAHTRVQVKSDFGLYEKLKVEHGNWPPYLNAWEPEEHEKV